MKTINIESIGKKFTGYGHYKITFEYNVDNGETEIESFTTTDMQEVDEWHEGGAERLVARHVMCNIDADAKIEYVFTN